MILIYPRHVANPQVMIGSLDDCQELYVADLLEVWGSPRTVDFNRSGGQLVFAGGTRAPFRGELTLHTPIDYMWINYYGGSGGAVFAWQGVYPAWWYCQPHIVDECMPF